LKLRVDLEKCTGHGRCYDLAPELFDEDEAGRCVLLHADVPAGLEDKARVALENCPEEAIEAGDQ
jgi:ferredoxin